MYRTNKIFTTYLLLIFININACQTLPIVNDANSKIINVNSDKDVPDIGFTLANPMDIFLNPELNKFVKSIIGNYGDEDHQLDIEELHRALQNPKILRAIQEIKNKSPKKYFGTTPSSIYLSSETTTVSKTTGIINILTTTTELITELKLERNDNSKNSRRRKMKNMFKLNTPVIPTIRS